MEKKFLGVFLLTLIALIPLAFAISADEAIAIVSIQNNYLLSGETANVAKELIQYKGEKYIVVAATNNENVTCYIPIKNSTSEVAKMDLEIREIIKATIVYTKMNELSQSITAANWPFSYYTKNTFYDLARDFTTMQSSVLTVKTELEKINAENTIISKTESIDSTLEEIVKESNTLYDKIEEGRNYEQNFFSAPDSNKVTKYENYYKNYFTLISDYKSTYTSLETKLNELSQIIASLQTDDLTVDQKRSLQSLLNTPTNARKLQTFFGTTDQLRTAIESVFTAARNSENYATTLASREVRNSAWKEMYGRSETLLKVDKSFETLEVAANAILSSENVDQWENTDAVSGLTTNWNSAKSRYNNAEYEKAKEYAIKAQKNVSQIIESGIKQTTGDTNNYVLIAVGILITALVGLFIYENFYLKKKKKKGEEFDEPNY